MTTNGEVIRRLVVDAGPFIALFNNDDRAHVEALRGFQELADRRVRVVVPLPIAFEVYKWLRYKVGADAARRGLDRMRRATDIQYTSADDFNGTAQIVRRMPDWRGSLEDALLAYTALAMRVPLWTMNYRDFAAFDALRFWTPAG